MKVLKVGLTSNNPLCRYFRFNEEVISLDGEWVFDEVFHQLGPETCSFKVFELKYSIAIKQRRRI